MCQATFAFGVMICILTAGSNDQESLPTPTNWHIPEPSVAIPEQNINHPLMIPLFHQNPHQRFMNIVEMPGSDQTFFVVGSGLTEDVFVWGRDAQTINGQRWNVNRIL